MDKRLLKAVEEVYPLRVQEYEQYMPNIDNPSVVEKVNAMITALHHMGRLTNHTVKQWNDVMKWVVEEGIENITRDHLDLALNTDLKELATQVTLDHLKRELDLALNNGLKELAERVVGEEVLTMLEDGRFETQIIEAINTMHTQVQDAINGFSMVLDQAFVSVMTFDAVGDGLIDDTIAVQSAIDYAETNNKKLMFPSGLSFLVETVNVNDTLIIMGEGATIKQLNDTNVDCFIVNGNNVEISGLHFDSGNSLLNDGLVIKGDNCKLFNVTTNGFFYSLDVSGDYCLVENYSNENSLYAALRLNANSKKLNLFNGKNIKALNSNMKGFVYNGIQGIRDIFIDGFECVSNAETHDTAYNSFLTDSAEDNTLFHIERLVLNNVYIKGGGSGAFKIENCRIAYLNNVVVNDSKPDYISAYGIRSACEAIYINNLKIDDRLSILGDVYIENLDYLNNPLIQKSYAIELKGNGKICVIKNADFSKANLLSLPIRIDRNEGVETVVRLKDVKGILDKNLIGVIVTPPNTGEFIQFEGNVYNYSAITSFTGNNYAVFSEMIKGRKIYDAPNAPTVGTFKKGSICYNSNPLSGSVIGWVCTETGTPGIWKGFGTIEA